MKLGVCVPNYGETSSVEGLRAVAEEAENLGYDSLWTTDHILMPKNSGTPYEKIFDSISTLAFLAPLTRKVKLGISSLIVAMRNPVVVAKQLATLDNLSGGRLILATSAGWNEKEFSNLGSNFHDRGRRVDESIMLLRRLWSGEASFAGKYLPQKLSDVVFEPRPVQKKLTIWIGGQSKAAMKRAAKLGDAWHPNVLPMDSFKNLVQEFRAISPDKEICPRIALNLKASHSEYASPQGERRTILSSNMEENKRVISDLKELGIEYLVVAPSHDGRASPSEQIEGLRNLAREQ
jgi:probable F420-dependent oxidoreductase